MEEIELIDIADENDHVIATMSRSEAHKQAGSYIRIVAAFVFNDKGEILMCRTAESKKVNALKWSYSAAGHVSSGESYDNAMKRELEEELGISSETIEYVGVIKRQHAKDSERSNSFHRIYKITHNGPYHPLEEEISEAKLYTLAALRAEIARSPKEFSQTSLEALKLVIG